MDAPAQIKYHGHLYVQAAKPALKISPDVQVDDATATAHLKDSDVLQMGKLGLAEATRLLKKLKFAQCDLISPDSFRGKYWLRRAYANQFMQFQIESPKRRVSMQSPRHLLRIERADLIKMTQGAFGPIRQRKPIKPKDVIPVLKACGFTNIAIVKVKFSSKKYPMVQFSTPAMDAYLKEKLRGPQEQLKKDMAKYDNLPAQIIGWPMLDPSEKKACIKFVRKIGLAKFNRIMEVVPTWYQGEEEARMSVASEISKLIPVLRLVMDLKIPEKLYRGISIMSNSALYKIIEEARTKKPFFLTSAKPLSSWSLSMQTARGFAFDGNGDEPIVVQLISDKGVRAALAPPPVSAPWFNKVLAAYTKAAKSKYGAGDSDYRQNEQEYALVAPKAKVKVVWWHGDEKSRKGILPKKPFLKKKFK